jgi:membrane associated rhomboid family serine protease
VIIPLRHENNRGRRWPYITITIIALSALLFLVAHNSLDEQFNRSAEVQSHTLRLAAAYPDAPLSQGQQELVSNFRRSQRATWDQFASGERNPEDKWELEMRQSTPDQIKQEMISLGSQLDQMRHSTIFQFGLAAPQPTLVSFITANFIEGSWLHLILNLWFLWLVGTALEEVWGPPLYAGIYLVSGIGGLIVQALANRSGMVPVIGASGAIAALLGAFLVRFSTSKIQLGFFYLRPKLLRFSLPAYAVLPLWVAGQFFSSRMSHEAGGASYWSQIGGFAIGLTLAIILRYSGIAKKMEQAIETQVGWSADPRIVKASEYLEENNIDSAIAELQAQIKDKPDCIEAWEILPSLYWKKGDIPAHQAALETVCRLHVKNKNFEAAWQDYEDYVRAGGGTSKMPCATWFELCRNAEDQQNWDRASTEYEHLAKAYPTERASVLSLISAARIHLRLGNFPHARKLYTAAQSSPVPHRDWDETIGKGLEKADVGSRRETVDVRQ